MRNLITSIAAVLSFGAQAAQTLRTPAFELKLGNDWRISTTRDPEQNTITSKQFDVGVTTSYVLHKAKPTDTERIAKKLEEFRLAGEERAAKEFNLRMTMAAPIVVPFSKGHQVAYFGHDNNGRQFRYLGLVFPNKTINVYAESATRTQQELEAIFNNLLKGLLPSEP
jgi:hypothetical protein